MLTASSADGERVHSAPSMAIRPGRTRGTERRGRHVLAASRERVQRALHSVRLDATGTILEFLPVSDGGRYRASPDARAQATFSISTSAPTASFAVLGPGVVRPAASSWSYNSAYRRDAYSGETRRALTSTGAALSTLTYTVGGTQFPFASPSTVPDHRTPVTFFARRVQAGRGQCAATAATRFKARSHERGCGAAVPLTGNDNRCSPRTSNRAASSTAPAARRQAACSRYLKLTGRESVTSCIRCIWTTRHEHRGPQSTRRLPPSSRQCSSRHPRAAGAMIVSLSIHAAGELGARLAGSRAYFAAKAGIEWGCVPGASADMHRDSTLRPVGLGGRLHGGRGLQASGPSTKPAPGGGLPDHLDARTPPRVRSTMRSGSCRPW